MKSYPYKLIEGLKITIGNALRYARMDEQAQTLRYLEIALEALEREGI